MKRFVPSLPDAADPEQEMDLQDAKVVSELFDQAATENLQSPLREGSVMHLPAKGWALMTGDLHDNGPNLQRIIKLAALHQSSDRHLILHEIVHGPHQVNGCDLSIRMIGCRRFGVRSTAPRKGRYNHPRGAPRVLSTARTAPPHAETSATDHAYR